MLLSMSVLLPFYILERPSKCPGRLLACHLSNITLSLLPHMDTVRFMIAISITLLSVRFVGEEEMM